MSRYVIWIVFNLYSATAWAHEPADGSVHATLGPFVFATHARTHDFDSPSLATFGALVEADLNNAGGVELTLIYLRKLYSIEREGLIVTDQVKNMYIAMGYRHWFGKHFSVAAAFFSSYAMGDPHPVRDDFRPQMAPKTSAYDTTEYGFDFSVQIEPWSQGRFSAVIDGRYSLSATPKSDEDSNHFGVLVGLKYFIQAKDLEDEG